MRKYAALSLFAIASMSMGVTITFSELAEGDVLSNQYAGVTFSSGDGGYGVNNPVATPEGFATTTNLTVTSTDVGGGVSAPVSGNLVHSFGAWLGENGDPVVHIEFNTAITFASIAVAGIANTDSTVLYAFNGAAFVDIHTAMTTGTTTLGVSGPAITDLVLTLGDFNDWVGFDNLNYEPVPEPATMAALGIGVALAARRRRNRR